MRQKKQTKMYNLVEKWKDSEQTKQAFCKAHQLNPTTFHYWIQKYNKYNLPREQGMISAQTPSFIPLSIKEPSRVIEQDKKSQRMDIELNYPNGVHLRLTGLISSTYLSDLIKLSL